MLCTNLGITAEATLRVARLVMMRGLLATMALLVTRARPVNSLPDAEVVKAAKGAKEARMAKLVLNRSQRLIAK